MKDALKLVCIYARHDPNATGVTHVAIQTETTPPYVFGTYCHPAPNELPTATDLAIMPVMTARNLFKFQKGRLEDCIAD